MKPLFLLLFPILAAACSNATLSIPTTTVALATVQTLEPNPKSSLSVPAGEPQAAPLDIKSAQINADPDLTPAATPSTATAKVATQVSVEGMPDDAPVIKVTKITTSASPHVVDIRWDKEPAAKIISLYSPYTTAGLAGAFDARYYIPEVQIWGDGRIIWVVNEGIGRRVLEGHLTTEQMAGLVLRIVEAGFFDWEDKYQTLGGNSSPPMHLRVNLKNQAKEVVEHGGAPEAYYQLRQSLMGGAGVQGLEYVPRRGYLTVATGPNEVDAPEWPAETTNITLDQIGEGCFVEGESLLFAWEIINKFPTGPVYVRSNGQVYLIMVQIPGLSYYEPGQDNFVACSPRSDPG